MKKTESEETRINHPLFKKSLEKNPFGVPKNYFSSLKEEIMLKKRISELGESSFITPPSYQQILRQDIESKISENELKTILPTTNPTVPAGYFESLHNRILAQTTGANINDANKNPMEHHRAFEEAPIRRLGIRKWIPYVAAASITVAVALFALFNGVKSPEGKTINYTAQVEEIPTDQIINYLAYYSESGDLQYISKQLHDRSTNITDNISSQEIEAYLGYGL